MDPALILPLDTTLATLQNAGGKGLNLSRLCRAGFPVPPGFILSTAAYAAFSQANGLDETIRGVLRPARPDDPASLEAASQAIRAQFAAGRMPPVIAAALTAALAAMGGPAVAVRSSATAEDLPGLSFAGQQDTFLNVVGEKSLYRAVIDCWSSLWTARAIGYRARNGIDHESVALAVVVQEMVPSETSGVLFTANPLTGRRTEMVIDATLGLGEALVAGQVEPDHYVIDADGRLVSKTLGRKATVVRVRAGGGTAAGPADAADRQVLDAAALQELARLGRQAADMFGAPQDIEWAGAGGQLYLLQSRPITTLYPTPEGMPGTPLRVLLSLGTFQGLLDPISPLGRDAFRGIIAGAAGMLGYRYSLETIPALQEAGERLWIDISGLVNSSPGRQTVLAALEYVEPGGRQALLGLVRAGELPAPGRPRLRTLGRLLRVFLPAVGRVLRALLRPDVQAERLLGQMEVWLEGLRAQFATAGSPGERLALIRRVPAEGFRTFLPQFAPRFGVGMAAYNLLTRLAAGLPEPRPDTRAMLRGLPHNVTTEMDLALWQAAQAIRADPASAKHLAEIAAAALAAESLAGQLPAVAQEAIAGFLRPYGARGLGEIDVGRPRWREDPTPLLQALQSYLRITDPHQAPDAVFERGRQAAAAEIERLVQALRGTRGGWIKARWARWAARRMRALAGLREAPKFAIVRILGLFRETLLADGAAWAAAGLLACAEDVFFLRIAELEALAAGERRDWRAVVEERRQAGRREQQRRQIPRLLLSDGRAFYQGVVAETAPGADVLSGSPVSPGVAEGTVRVVLDPRGTQLLPGEILVCPGTDPSWTPLFLAAGGLVMEVGGMMTHGAVVAREYGLPAVVGVHEVTVRLHTGQRVRVNGSTGQVLLLE